MVEPYQTTVLLGRSMISSTDLIGSMIYLPVSDYENSMGNTNTSPRQALRQVIRFEGSLMVGSYLMMVLLGGSMISSMDLIGSMISLPIFDHKKVPKMPI
jgi:hypothetical protein